jgi:hypothetical protein
VNFIEPQVADGTTVNKSENNAAGISKAQALSGAVVLKQASESAELTKMTLLLSTILFKFLNLCLVLVSSGLSLGQHIWVLLCV